MIPRALLVTHDGYNQRLLPDSYPGEMRVLLDNGDALPETVARMGDIDLIIHTPSAVKKVANPSVEALMRTPVRKACILMDGAKPFWQNWARRAEPYYDAIMSIDYGYPHKLWSPIIPRMVRPWGERYIPALFVGTVKESRGEWAFSQKLRCVGGANSPVSNEEMWDLMSRAKVIVNDQRTRFGVDHVKGRPFEAAAVGACLLERRTEATEPFFRSGVEREEFDTMEDMDRLIDELQGVTGLRMAEAMRSRYEANYTAAHFWDRFFGIMSNETGAERLAAGS